MIVVCILVENQYAEKVRDRVKSVLPMLQEDGPSLRIPVSASGELPATHWFCFFKATQPIVERLMAAQEYSIVEVSRPSQFLLKHGLKLVESKDAPRKKKYKKSISKIKQRQIQSSRKKRTQTDQ